MFAIRSVRRLARSCAALAAVLATAGCGDTLGPGPEPAEELLFLSSRVSSQTGNWANLDRDIFRASATGGAVENLTAAPAQYRSLSVSVDGRTVSYIRLTSCYAVWVMDRDGSNARQVAGFDPFRCIHMPRISPDGSHIAMTSSRDAGWHVWVVDTAGGGATNVSGSLGTGGWTWGWSPDGRVVFHHLAADLTRTYIVNRDGSNLQPFFERDGDHSPVWSPDGSRIAFISDREGTNDVFVVNADGSGLRRLTDLAGDAGFGGPIDINQNAVSPWSPDGTQLVFRNLVGSQSRLYRVRADGTALTPLADESLDARWFNGWSHSGRWIAFTSTAANGVTGLTLHIADADGSNARTMTTGNWQDGHALWLPRR